MSQSSNKIPSPALGSPIDTNPTTKLFKEIVRNAGITLISNDGRNLLTQEQALVVRDIDISLEESGGNDIIDHFIEGFKILIKKEKYLKKALLPTSFKNEGDMDFEQESLFRIFLNVDRLQGEITDILLHELTSTVSNQEDDGSYIRLLLNQFQYLPYIKDPENLTAKLLDIIDMASFPSQLEILNSIPDILPDNECVETAEKFVKMLDKDDNLSVAIIDCLNALNLSSKIRIRIQNHILTKLSIGFSLTTFPVFLDFLMTDYSASTFLGILMRIRSALNSTMDTEDQTDKDKESIIIIIFDRLQRAAMSKQIAESWLAAISKIQSHAGHKPIDIVILFMLHSNTKLKKRTVETTFRKRVKDGLFKYDLLEQVFEKYLPQQLLKDYFDTIIAIGLSMLRSSNDPSVIEFAGSLFKLLFTNSHTERTLRQQILENMIMLIGRNDQKNVTIILKIIIDLLDEIAKTPNHAIILMRLLEQLTSFELKDVKLVFEILSFLTCSEESLSGLKEELHIIVEKHLCSTKLTNRQLGIVSAVVMVKHIATTTEDQREISLSEHSITSISQLEGAAKEAAEIVDLTNRSTTGCPELVSLLYDQLASMLVKNDRLDIYFLVWLHETLTDDFDNDFVTETVCQDINDLQFSKQYNLNAEHEVTVPLAINIGEVTLKSGESILVLAPHFRLVRLLDYRLKNGKLASISALLGCGVILPKPEQRDGLGIEQLKQMTDCIFHCINWFREIISGFVLQKNEKLQIKVLQRLDNLHELENLLTDCLDNVPEHTLPVNYVQALIQIRSPVKEQSKTIKRPRKKFKTKEFVEDTSVVASTSTSKVTMKTKEEIKFREIDMDLVCLLKYPLDSGEITSSNQLCLNINQVNFILKDFVTKLSLLLKGQDFGLSHFNLISISEMMKDCVKIMPHIKKHLDVIIKKLSQDPEDEVKCSFGLVLECLSLIFSWSGFHDKERADLLRAILKVFWSQNTSTPPYSTNHFITDLINGMEDYSDHCSSLTHAVHLIQIMEALQKLRPNSKIRSIIAKTAGKLLNKQYDKQNSANIDILTRSYLSSANIKTICGMVGTLQEQAPKLKHKNDSLEMLKNFTKSNFYVLYRNLWSCLHDRVKTEIESLTNAQHLTLWRTTALTMQGLMTVVKAQETKCNLICFLKKSIAILKIFLSHGIPIIEIELKFEPDRIVEILKIMQFNTRFLHKLCCHSKLTKDASLMSHVPRFRLTLETLIFKVKSALDSNGCSAAFWMGNLKNQDLEGEDIITQSTENSARDDSDEEEIEEVEEEIDEEMPYDDSNETSSDKSGSEVFE